MPTPSCAWAPLPDLPSEFHNAEAEQAHKCSTIAQHYKVLPYAVSGTCLAASTYYPTTTSPKFEWDPAGRRSKQWVSSRMDIHLTTSERPSVHFHHDICCSHHAALTPSSMPSKAWLHLVRTVCSHLKAWSDSTVICPEFVVHFAQQTSSTSSCLLCSFSPGMAPQSRLYWTIRGSRWILAATYCFGCWTEDRRCFFRCVCRKWLASSWFSALSSGGTGSESECPHLVAKGTSSLSCIHP